MYSYSPSLVLGQLSMWLPAREFIGKAPLLDMAYARNGHSALFTADVGFPMSLDLTMPPALKLVNILLTLVTRSVMLGAASPGSETCQQDAPNLLIYNLAIFSQSLRVC